MKLLIYLTAFFLFMCAPEEPAVKPDPIRIESEFQFTGNITCPPCVQGSGAFSYVYWPGIGHLTVITDTAVYEFSIIRKHSITK